MSGSLPFSIAYGITMWHRRPSECREVYPFQLLIERESAIGELPLLYDRAERGRDYRTGRAIK